MKTSLKIFGLFFVLWLVILVAWGAYYSRKTYVLDLGTSTETVSCQVFSFLPEENTVYCDEVRYLGVRGIGIR